MLASLCQSFVHCFLHNIPEVLTHDNKVVVGPGEGQGQDGWTGANTAIDKAEYMGRFHSFKLIIHLDMDSRKLCIQEGKNFNSIVDPSMLLGLAENEDHVTIILLSSMKAGSLRHMKFDRIKVISQETLITSI